MDFRNVILILTSNLGSQYLVDQEMPFEERTEKAMQVVHQAFRPEFLNRLDDIIMFEPLSSEHLGQIVNLQIQGMGKRLTDRRLTLDVTPAALEWLGLAGYDPAFGAARCVAWYSARSATVWRRASSRALSTMATP